MWTLSSRNVPDIALLASEDAACRFAASELKEYLRKILGTEPRIADSADASGIHLTRVDDGELGDEGYEFAVSGDAFRISGGGPAGLVYGVYDFLRRFCGCQFSGLGPDGEFIPRREKIEIPEAVGRHTPQLWYRGMQFSQREPLDLMVGRIDWMAKNGLNYVMIHPARPSGDEADAYDPATGMHMAAAPSRRSYTNEWFREHLLPEIQKRGMKVDMNHHNLLYWLPPADHFADHPEWYALKDGERVPRGAQLSICTSNRDAVRTLIDNVLDYLRDNPVTKVVGVIPEDGFGLCECEECRKMDVSPDDATRKIGNWKSLEGQNHSKIRRYALLANEVARAVRAEFPDVLVGTSAYVDMVYPPSDVEIEDNIVPWIAIYWRCSAHPLAPDACGVNAFYCDVLKKWRAAHRGKVILYEYYMGMNTYRSMPFPAAEVICREWPQLKELGAAGATIQSLNSNQNIYGLNYLAFARCGWQDSVSYEALFDGYLLGMFGSAADDIRPIYETLQAAVERIEREGPEISPFLGTESSGCYQPNPHAVNYLIQPGEIERFKAHIACALGKAAPGREQRQVQDLAAAVDYWEMAAPVFAMEARAAQMAQEGYIDAAIVLYEEVIYRVKPIVDYIERQPLRGWIAQSACIDQFRRNTVQRVRTHIEELKGKAG